MSDRPEPFVWEHDAYHYSYENVGLTGYTGLDYHCVAQLSVMRAWRAQIGKRGFYKGALAVLPDGTLIAAPVDGLAPLVEVPYPSRPHSQPMSCPVRLHQSTDGARTWQPIVHSPLIGKEASLTSLEDGVLLFTNESTDGVGYSDDGGKTWKIIPFHTPRVHERETVGTVRSPIFHPDGTISFLRCVGVGATTWPEPDDFPRCTAWLVHSTDGGRTWNDRTQVETWDHASHQFAEADFARMPDGRLLSTSRLKWLYPLEGKPLPYPPASMPNDHAAGHMVLMESTDEGRTWTEPREFLQYSEIHGQLTLLQDGRLLCTYSHYHLPFGVAGVVSDDYGKTWNFDHPLQLALSNPHGSAWPTTRQLSDGTLVTLYALTPYHIEPAENGPNVCHTVRWELPPRADRAE